MSSQPVDKLTESRIEYFWNIYQTSLFAQNKKKAYLLDYAVHQYLIGGKQFYFFVTSANFSTDVKGAVILVLIYLAKIAL